jgi:hypothetical protein
MAGHRQLLGDVITARNPIPWIILHTNKNIYIICINDNLSFYMLPKKMHWFGIKVKC